MSNKHMKMKINKQIVNGPIFYQAHCLYHLIMLYKQVTSLQ